MQSTDTKTIYFNRFYQQMNDFISGQRWISNTESELGLGLILEVSFNRVTVLFLATGAKRIYAQDNAPLTRVKFAVGDVIESTDNLKIKVQKISQQQGLLTYIGLDEEGEAVAIEEIDLNHHIQFNKPQERLFTGQFDPSAWFTLRYETWRKLQQHQQSPIKGLQGGRTSLIAHQLFIAHEAANRFAPRIMLADEVGLGKTIEAGLILHYRLLNNLSKRVLIIVPESLLHQWLVEMLRRFNLKFSIFDEGRCLESKGKENPFVAEQLVLCSQDFFARYPKRQAQAIAAGWDMVVVDEAHHLEWNQVRPSPEYQFIEELSLSVQGLILLTATPEQLGKESHFARLRLLDPDRFYDFEAFLAEEQHFAPVAEVAKLLLAEKLLDETTQQNLKNLLKQDNVDGLLNDLSHPEKAVNAREQLIKILLDHHGTGRILFRNSRQTVKGFPQRQRHAYPLQGTPAPDNLLQDPHFIWLMEKLKQLGEQRAVLICHHVQTVINLEKMLKNRGVAAAVFHENMSIIERDRAAAYFADQESSAQLLICSEIGSEGRNFQFVHHLILFDLPTNPDLLQQRIGRLDRIGQKNIIQLHIPYLQNTAQHTLFRWYDEGFNAFEHNCSAAQAVADQLQEELALVLKAQDSAMIEAFIAKTKNLNAELEIEMHNGRDQLLELNSCRPEEANALITQVEQIEAQNLWDYAEPLFDCFGVDIESHSDNCYILRPSESLRVSHFPYLVEDGMTVTVNREIALAREDMSFITLEHPMMTAAMDLVLSTETGNASVCAVKHPDLKGGQFLLEMLFIVECSAPENLQVNRFLPHTPIRVLINQFKQDVSETISHESLVETGDNINHEQISSFLAKQRQHIVEMLAIAEQNATKTMNELIAQTNKTMLASLTGEIKRLVRLKKINPSIKEEEIEQLKDVTILLHENINAAQLRLDAVRFLVTR
jgi:ATP-dependent helicase HepA